MDKPHLYEANNFIYKWAVCCSYVNCLEGKQECWGMSEIDVRDGNKLKKTMPPCDTAIKKWPLQCSPEIRHGWKIMENLPLKHPFPAEFPGDFPFLILSIGQCTWHMVHAAAI